MPALSPRALLRASLALLVATATALLLQVTLLGAWGVGAAPDRLDLQPVANVERVKSTSADFLRFDASTGPAIAQHRGVTVPAADVLALVLNVTEGDGAQQLALGWRTGEDSRRTASASVFIERGSAPRTVLVPLVGHARWRGSVLQMALASEGRRAGSISEGGVLGISSVELVHATPLGALRLLRATWFGDARDLAVTQGAAVRVLALPLWLTFVSVFAMALVAFMERRQPAQRASALTALAGLLAILLAATTVAARLWPGFTPALLGAGAAALALLLAGGPWWAQSRQHTLVVSAATLGGVALFACVAVWLAPLVAAIALIPLMILLAAPWLSRRVTTAAGLLALAPAFAVAAAAQQILPAPVPVAPLRDPTQPLLAIVQRAAGLPALALGLLGLHRLWPAPATTPRWAGAAAAATAWAASAAICVLAMPRLSRLPDATGAPIGLLLPALATLLLAMLPRLREVAARSEDTVPVPPQRSEADLSPDALALLDGHGERVRHNLEAGHIGAAQTALTQMERMAPAARRTALARLRVALAQDDLGAADAAGAAMREGTPLGSGEADALLELAHRRGEHNRVIELAPLASAGLGNARAVALAHALSGNIDAALATLDASPHVAELARDIVELHLLRDDVTAAQLALDRTGIALDNPVGEAYIARLGMRATGSSHYADAASGLATWHPQLGVAHAALGESMLRQRNSSGARARLVLAMRLDPVLWPLQARVQAIDTDANATHASTP